jgi:hypothetical protein
LCCVCCTIRTKDEQPGQPAKKKKTSTDKGRREGLLKHTPPSRRSSCRFVLCVVSKDKRQVLMKYKQSKREHQKISRRGHGYLSRLSVLCVWWGTGLCDGLIPRPEGSYQLWCVILCDPETSARSGHVPRWAVAPEKI